MDFWKFSRVRRYDFSIIDRIFYSGQMIAHSNGLITLNRMRPNSAHFEAILQSYNRLNGQNPFFSFGHNFGLSSSNRFGIEIFYTKSTTGNIFSSRPMSFEPVPGEIAIMLYKLLLSAL